ncbi:hypothetical protein PQX77_015631 [Marasmius sp. AFHP31]|nr:hypothetical protein PQX77_015631 [Marasmius sp. AFHP31]
MASYPESLLGKSSRPPENFRQFFRNSISDINRKEVKDYLSDAEGAYNECQLEINKYKGLILMLESRREGMKKVMERCRSLLSPVHRLPSEVLLEIFEHCCELNDLSNRKIPPTMALSMLPWANIRHLKLREYTDASDLAFIESCTSLQHLTLVNVNNSMGSSDELTIQSNTIRSLIIKGLESDPSLIYRFNFPQLSSLDIQRVFIEDSHMEPFKQRTFLPITSLRLDSIMCFTDSFLIAFLRCTPELRTLDISECWENPAPIITDSFSVHLTVNPDGFWNPPFLPRLAELKLKCHTKQLDEQTFADALTSRWLPNPAVASDVRARAGLKASGLGSAWRA